MTAESIINMTTTKACTCGGANPNCFKCDGTGIISSTPTPPPKKFAIRGIAHDGTLSPDELHKRQIRERQAAAEKEFREMERLRSLRHSETRRSVSRHNQESPTRPKSQSRISSLTYRCVSCSYRLNRSPELRCAWCNELGPYELACD